MKLYNEVGKTGTDTPMFFGNRNVRKYAGVKYPVFETIYEDSLENFWKKQEQKLPKDPSDYGNLNTADKRVFNLNIKRQSVLDSIQGSAIFLTLGRVCSNPEFEKVMVYMEAQEYLHSDTYGYILSAITDNPTELLDEILEDELITEHTIRIKKAYEDLYEALAAWETFEFKFPWVPDWLRPKDIRMEELKRKMYRAIIAWNIIEGVRFFVSFACTFAFAEEGVMMGNAQELKLIARDELTHLRISQGLIRILKREPSEGFQEIISSMDEEVEEMYREAGVDEEEWINKLYELVPTFRLSKENLIRYSRYNINVRSKAIGYKPPYSKEEVGDIHYMNKWLGGVPIEELGQDVQTTEYKIGKTTNVLPEQWAHLLD